MQNRSCLAWSGLARPVSPIRCGCIWFVHIGKTGGTTVERHMEQAAKANGWAYERMFGRPVSLWNTSLGWRRVVAEMRKPRPSIAFVSQHHGAPGLGGSDDMLRSTILPMRRALEAKGCRLVLATVLREPVERTISSLFFNNIGRRQLPSWAASEGSNYQTKYLVGGWRLATAQSRKRPSRVPLASASAMLSHFDLVGRTEAMSAVLQAMDRITGVEGGHGAATPQLNRGRTRRYSLTPSEVRLLHNHTWADASLYYRFCQCGAHACRGMFDIERDF